LAGEAVQIARISPVHREYVPSIGPLEYREQDAALLCHQCRLRYPVRDDIPIMLIDEATPL
jgi:uncharacterized protein YbaR (Trm112 family)